MGGEDTDKIIRIPGDTLLIKVTPEEVQYRNKYLPDPKKLTDEKLVCTVCSVSLAQDIHKGKQIYIHRCLQVLVCEFCFTFYGDGCFSADEDGDDKYCRWCGQGGTLFLCSACTCAFCQKCVKLNLKASVLADLENDDWKCYICNPRPLFGSRAICWGAEELNKIGKERELEKTKKQKERLEKLEEKKKEETSRKSRKQSSSEDEVTSKKRKSRANSSESSSPEVMPAKRPKRTSLETRNLNGSLSRKKRKDTSSDDGSSDGTKKITRRSSSRNKKNKKITADSSSEDDNSDIKSRRKTKSKKKKAKNSSDDSSDGDYKISKRKSIKKAPDSSDDDSADEKHTKKKKMAKKKKENLSDLSSDEKKKKVRRHKDESSDESADDKIKRSRKLKKKKDESSDSDSDDNLKKDKKKSKFKNPDDRKKNEINSDGGEDVKKKKNDETIFDEKSEESRSKDSSTAVDSLVKKRIKLAILWLDTAIKDIAELGSLISLRATKFAKKKINSENLKSYEDVLSTVSKLKQLMSGIHSNYDHIEKNLDAQLKPWKILTGVEESETEKPAEEETRLSADGSVSESQNISVDSHDCNNKKEIANENTTDIANSTLDVEIPTNVCDKKVETKLDNESNNLDLKWDNLSVDEDSDNDNLNVTEAITKASETLDKLNNEEEDLKTNKNSVHDDHTSSEEASKDDSSKKMDDTIIKTQSQKNVSFVDDSSKGSQSDSDEKNSNSDKQKSRKSGYKSLLGSNKIDYKNQETKDNTENEDVLKKLQTTKAVTEGVTSESEMSVNQ
uniref:PHD-type domain-containing protein n=1 Tax=Cuerna arida TaxID=1464854 RepID=A0A1B6ELZ9_9HEMI